MAASLLLRQGLAGGLKTVLLEAGVFRGLASTVPLSAESGKNEKGLPPHPKKQSPPKNVVEPKERGQQLATPTADELSENVPSPTSSPPAVNRGRVLAGPKHDASMSLTDQGVLRFVPRKTLVEFPQKVAPPFRKQGSDSEGTQQSRKGTDDSSSSSSSSSSDSESDEEGDSSEAGPQAKSKRRRGFPAAEASHSSADGAPPVEISAQEKTVSQRPHPDLVSAQRPRQAKKKGASGQPSQDRKDPKPKATAPKSHAGEKFMEQDVKEKQWQKVSTSNEIDKESRKQLEVKKPLSDRKSGLSTQPRQKGSPAPTQSAETRAGRRLPVTPETRERLLEKQVPEPDGEVALSLFKKENLGKQVAEGISKAKEEILEDQLPVKNVKPVPVHSKDVFDGKTAVLKLEEKGGIIEGSATPVEGQDGTQESPPAATLAEPFDNTTYKNLQHHDYNMYTFLDLDLELSKFRMPQPSSGRESPRH
ncbi:NADH dehydrogenase [ubiquinone] flavoprotein 3, mitochondrial isoform X1 [Kogia breviceps]|uniref:NADH dehydrogenase [ubiquinone] flavoprotein 3, mitochondrial isoform X1 n=1 Tax=Kogia breviceps TaxID=27615 RepID=UPI0027956900|nr:NADH dehydrogenase [ubiquinone] flavoprotein 3, mitochondrial isoform X1 [Kogia breviceps]